MLTTDEISRIVAQIFESTLGLTLAESSDRVVPDGRQRYLTGTLHLSGGFTGAVTLDCTEDLAKRAAAIMFDEDPETISTEDVHDSLGELTNMTGGNLKSLIAEKVGSSCQISLPTVTQGSDYLVIIPNTRLETELSMTCCEAGGLRVSLLIEDKQGSTPTRRATEANKVG